MSRLISTSRFIANALGSPPRRYQQRTSTSPGGTERTHVIRHPDDNEINRNMRQQVLEAQDESRSTNSIKAQTPKAMEYFQYCDYAYSTDPYKYHLVAERVYRFMWYQCFREQKAKGLTKAQRALPPEQRDYFDPEDYEKVIAHLKKGPASRLAAVPQPTNPIGPTTFTAYQSVMKKIYNVQVAMTGNSGLPAQLRVQWDFIWIDEDMKILRDHVKGRKPKRDKANYKEKVTGEFSPYTIVEHYEKMEDYMWCRSQFARGYRSVNKSLRHRFCLLYLTSGVLRSESLHRAELSDFLGINLPKAPNDVQAPYLMVNQIPIGKTASRGARQFGRATRHKEVCYCAINGLAFYLQHRLFCTREFETMTVEDWMKNEEWFDIKLLIDVGSPQNNKTEMRNDSYGDCVGDMLKALGLACNKIQHLGRNIGPKTLEMCMEEAENIRRMGQWAEGVQDRSYSTKLPMSPIRALAGFTGGKDSIYWLPRSTVEPSKELLAKTPIGKWVYAAYDAVVEADKNCKKQTARAFLSFLMDINKIFLQDAAAMMIEQPERCVDHPLFKELHCLLSDEFASFKEEMRVALKEAQDPLDSNLQRVLPGLHQWHRANDSAMGILQQRVDSIAQTVNDGISSLISFSRQCENRRQHTEQRLATILESGAMALRGNGATTMEDDLVALTQDSHELDDVADFHNDPPPPLFFDSEMTDAEPLNNNRTTSPVEYEAAGTLLQVGATTATTAVTGTGGLSGEEIRCGAVIGVTLPNSSFYIRPNQPSLSALMDEYCGRADFHDALGGPEGREKRWKNKWRKHWSAAQTAQYLRTVAVVKGIRAFGEEQNLDEFDACATLQKVFKEECKCSVANMKKYLQEKELLGKKKSRGRTKLAE
ncbi:unknown protein [Seminavis robusta]|uniref:Ndc10 domain-containing protein n=1 Tax=Seminavis robusta TaxID=568900 RepID=A0A9N8DCT7_9STRA|nr:unknown protein [Seminavis robusta]|eukprot:Sro64_g036331.1  (876) ;mRNA; r:81667-84294